METRKACVRGCSSGFFKSRLEAGCTRSQGGLLWFLVQSHRFKHVWIIQQSLVHHTWVLLLWEYESLFIPSLLVALIYFLWTYLMQQELCPLEKALVFHGNSSRLVPTLIPCSPWVSIFRVNSLLSFNFLPSENSFFIPVALFSLCILITVWFH